MANTYCHEKYCNVLKSEVETPVKKTSQNSAFLGWFYMAGLLAGAAFLDNLLL